MITTATTYGVGDRLMRMLLAVCILFATQVSASDVSFYKDIQPIILRHCTSCHRPGQSAPFSLISYKDVVKHASMIKQVVHTGYMPPWQADTSFRKFVDQRVMSAGEIQTLTEWVENGLREGNEKDGTQITVYDKPSNLGKPDLVLTASEVFRVPGTNNDTFAYFVMPYTLPTDTNVLAFEFVPGNPVAVHHANTWVFPAPSEYDRIYDFPEKIAPPAPLQLQEYVPSLSDMFLSFDTNATAGYEFEYPDFFPKVPALYYDGWVPGASARTWPRGFGFKMPTKGVVIMQIHYGPTPVPLTDQSSVNLFFTSDQVERVIESYNIGTGGGIAEPEPQLVLLPDSVQTFEITTEITEDQSYIALNPHMHYLGKEMKAFVVQQNGDTIPLVWVKNWNFRWQEFYKPMHPIHIPAGSVLKVVATFDNTRSNPDNRFDPPKTIRGGALSTEEMMSLIVMSVRYRKGDEEIVLSSDHPSFSNEEK